MQRFLEYLLASCLIISLAPFMLIVSLLILITMGRPIFFTQLRTGLHAKPFKIIKFRTMDVSDKPDDETHGDDTRLTPLGKWLRKFSIDEWPQLFNIIKGDLSFVGPRPLLTYHLKNYTPEQSRRHQVKPGLTGWAQINGRNSIKWEDKLKLDVWYVDHKSWWLDLKIVLITLFVVITAKDVEYQQHTVGSKK
ncbi:MAG TPA: sugar transferase [Gammaproteobacteria bacterium]|nr:sugar transferase [Gammaproteobacteria bacterium]